MTLLDVVCSDTVRDYCLYLLTECYGEVSPEFLACWIDFCKRRKLVPFANVASGKTLVQHIMHTALSMRHLEGPAKILDHECRIYNELRGQPEPIVERPIT